MYQLEYLLFQEWHIISWHLGEIDTKICSSIVPPHDKPRNDDDE